jgi:hypothetical protein
MNTQNPTWILVESSAFQRNEIWQKSLPKSSFLCLLIPVECRHSGAETGMFPGMGKPEWGTEMP